MPATRFDCMVIGSGPGGYVAAIRAAQLGMKTAVIERDAVGGRCLNHACIPAKAVLRSADLLTEVRESEQFGLRVAGVEVDFDAVQRRREKVISTLTGGVAGLFEKNGIELIEGEGSLTPSDAPLGVRVAGEQYEAGTVILASGSVRRSIPGVELAGPVIGTEEAWALAKLPARLAVLGAGASGAEIASAYARLGSEVTLIEMLDRPLPSEDADISRIVERGLRRQGMRLETGVAIEDVGPEGDTVSFSLRGETVQVDRLVIATGRAPDVEGLGLDGGGVELEQSGLIAVDATQATSRRGVYAIGDLVHGPALAHKASEEGIVAVESAAGRETHPLSHLDIPRATFCMPNVGSFGLTEAQAREQGHDVVVGKVPYGAVGGGAVYGDRSGLVKVVGETRYGELLGGHIVGSRATELIQELVNIRVLEGGYTELARIVHGHPTLSEAVMEAGRAADGWLIHG
ncbi:MAG: dihydrolipoyl dehydrogenase [Solirubrobacteraceae bacterium]